MLQSMARRAARAGDLAVADAMLSEAFLALQDELGPDDERLEQPLLEIAELCERRGRIERARAILRRVLALRTARQGPDAPSVRALQDHLDALHQVHAAT